MEFTLGDVLNDIGAILSQDTDTPSGDDLTVQVNLTNQALGEWGNYYEWKALRIPQHGPTITLSQTSIGLPANFRKLMSRPYRMDLTADNDYEEVRGEEFYHRRSADPSARFCIVGGDNARGKYLLVNPALPSGASLLLDYQAYPSSMATLQDVSVCPSKAFLVSRVLNKIYQSRSDERFPTFKAEADDALEQMMEEEASGSGAMTNQIGNYYQKIGFRIGE